MIRRHDRYILKSFWASLGAVLIVFTVLSVVLDLSDRLSRVTRNWESIQDKSGQEPGVVLVKFYGALIPFIWMQMMPFCVPIAAAFSLARFNRHNEITPLLAGGVSMRRVLMPIIISGLLVALLMLAARAYVVPELSRDRMRYTRILSRASPDRIVHVPHFHDPSGARVSCAAFMPLDLKLEKAQVTFRDLDGTPRALYWYPILQWVQDQGQWIASEGGQYLPLKVGAESTKRVAIPPGEAAPIEAPVSLYEITLARSRSGGLSFDESRELQRANPTNPRFVMMHHELYTGPLAVLVMLLIALPFYARVGVRNPIPGMIGSLGIAALYLGMTFLLGSVGSSGEYHPIVLAWLPTAIFGSLGLALYMGLES